MVCEAGQAERRPFVYGRCLSTKVPIGTVSNHEDTWIVEITLDGFTPETLTHPKMRTPQSSATRSATQASMSPSITANYSVTIPRTTWAACIVVRTSSFRLAPFDARFRRAFFSSIRPRIVRLRGLALGRQSSL